MSRKTEVKHVEEHIWLRAEWRSRRGTRSEGALAATEAIRAVDVVSSASSAQQPLNMLVGGMRLAASGKSTKLARARKRPPHACSEPTREADQPRPPEATGATSQRG